jgi:hypothetical protein
VAIETKGNTRYRVVLPKNSPDKPLYVAFGDDSGGGINPPPDGGDVTVTFPVRTPTTTSVAASTSSQQLLPENGERKGFSFYNNSSGLVLLSFTGPATETNFWVALPPRGFLLLDQQLIIGNAIHAIWLEDATGTIQVTDYV